MLECLIIGDSIAQGIANVRTECLEYANIGWTSKQTVQVYGNRNLEADTVIISLGTNDTKYVNTQKELSRLRSKIRAKRVVWIIPAAVNPKSGVPINVINTVVYSIAAAYGDMTLELPKTLADRYHPTSRGYRKLAKETK